MSDRKHVEGGIWNEGKENGKKCDWSLANTADILPTF